MNIEYSPESIKDLIRLREFVEIKNPYAAKRISKELLDGVAKLKIFPKMGICVSKAPVPELVRDLFVSDYTVRYLIKEESVFILRVWHGKEIEKNL